MIERSKDTWTNCLSGKEYDREQMNEYYRHMALDIARDRNIQALLSWLDHDLADSFPP